MEIVPVTPDLPRTVGALRASGHVQRPVKHEIRDNLLAALAEGRDPWPGLHGFETTVPVTLDMITSAHSYQERALLIQNFVKQNPEHATLVVRDLLKSAKNTKEPVNG